MSSTESVLPGPSGDFAIFQPPVPYDGANENIDEADPLGDTEQSNKGEKHSRPPLSNMILPPGLSVELSSLPNAGLGIWTDVTIPKGTILGVFKIPNCCETGVHNGEEAAPETILGGGDPTPSASGSKRPAAKRGKGQNTAKGGPKKAKKS